MALSVVSTASSSAKALQPHVAGGRAGEGHGDGWRPQVQVQ